MTASSDGSGREASLPIRLNRLAMEWRGGMLRDISIDGRLAYRGVGFLVRDRFWNTLPAEAAVSVRSLEPDRAELAVRLACRGFGLEVAADIDILAAETSLSFAVDGRIERGGRFNRIGIVVLHAMPEAAGARYELLHVDGGRDEGAFPEPAVPSPLFVSVRAIGHVVAPGLRAECLLEGEDFETEDQRVFSDASLKTYSRSNALPRPIRLRRGARVRQAAAISWSGRAEPEAGAAQPVAIDIGGQLPRAMPPLGLMLSDAPPPAGAVEAMRESGARFLLCRLGRNTGAAALRRLSRICLAGDRPVVLEIEPAGVGDPAELMRRAAGAFAGASVEAVRLPPDAGELAGHARACFPDARLAVAGPRGLVDLIRGAAPGWAQAASFPTAAIIHDADPRTVMETALSLPAMVAACRARYALPVHIGPATIGVTRHPHMSSPLRNPDARDLPMTAHSPLVDAPFAAAWSLAYAAGAAPLVDSICLFASHGPHGLVGADGRTRPAMQAFRALAAGAGRPLLEIRGGSDGLACLAFGEPSRPTLLIANLTPRPLALRLPASCDGLEPAAGAARNAGPGTIALAGHGFVALGGEKRAA